MIQILTYSGSCSYLEGNEVIVNSMHSPQSLDEFEINIISLQEQKLWENDDFEATSINNIEDLRSLSIMIDKSKNSSIVILFPTNILYRYNFFNGKYMKEVELKNMLKQLETYLLPKLHPQIGSFNLVYENTQTKVGNESIKASFFFDTETKAAKKSEKSNKPTVVKFKNIILSTLQIENYNQIIGLLRDINLLEAKEDAPQWVKEVHMFNDDEQFKIIEENNAVISSANESISAAKNNIDKNNEYKSVLYTNGDELVKVIFDILEQMLGCDLSSFEDKKLEDFAFDIDGYYYIGEIKGVSHNVKNENVSQLDVHYQSFIEDNQADETKVKALLIINHQKNKQLDEREPIHDRQEKLAERNGSLIIETIVLLKMFEKYLNNQLSREECINLLQNNKGILRSNQF